jgi:glyoxylase-like metal-dependent hydrolase (beta-lactamase superfamily II)
MRTRTRVVIISVLVVIILLVALPFLVMGSWMSTVATGRVAENIYVIDTGMGNPGYANFFLVETGEGYIAIDTGTSAEEARDGLVKLNISPAMVTHVFLTHADSDHAGGLSAFPNAKIFIHEDEEQMIKGETPRVFMGIFPMYYDKPFSGYKTLGDNEKVQVHGRVVQAIPAPGHTPGHAAYLVDGRYMFLGDLARVMDGSSLKILPEFINNDSELSKVSLETIVSKYPDLDIYCTAHGGILKGGAAKQ